MAALHGKTGANNSQDRLKIAIFGPSKRFLSGITYFTIRLANALIEIGDVNAVLFRNMLPKKLFQGGDVSEMTYHR